MSQESELVMTKGYRIVAAVIPIDDDQPSAASPFSQPWRRIMFLENQVSVDEMQRDGTDVVEREWKPAEAPAPETKRRAISSSERVSDSPKSTPVVASFQSGPVTTVTS